MMCYALGSCRFRLPHFRTEKRWTTSGTSCIPPACMVLQIFYLREFASISSANTCALIFLCVYRNCDYILRRIIQRTWQEFAVWGEKTVRLIHFIDFVYIYTYLSALLMLSIYMALIARTFYGNQFVKHLFIYFLSPIQSTEYHMCYGNVIAKSLNKDLLQIGRSDR